VSGFEHALLLLLLTAALSVLGRWLPWPQLITYLAGGAVAALAPGFPRLSLDPGFFFLCFVPPLVFSDGWLMPLREFAKARRPILLLSIGLVGFTTLCVGFAAHMLVPGLPLAMAFALGAVVSPTDAVAVNAATERLRVPARITTILSGESLMNDASGLVAFKFALGAAAAGVFSPARMAREFLLVSTGGLALGLAAGYAVGRLRDLLRHLGASDGPIETTLSLLTPYAAYLLAEDLGASGILAVVAAGLYSGWRDPVRMDAETRQSVYAAWTLVVYWLNGIAFMLLGLQAPALFRAVGHDFTAARLAGLAAAVSAVAIAARIVWVIPGTYVPFLLPGVRRRETPSPLRNVLVVCWAGMRGTVTLAAALSIPLFLPSGMPYPGRDIVIFLAFGVIATTLLVQGTTLEPLIRRLGIREDESLAVEERLARIAAVEAGLKALREIDAASPEETAALSQVVSEYEQRLAVLTTEGETRRSASMRRGAEHAYRMAALRAERKALDDLWRSNVIIDEVHRPLQHLLDHEETVLRRTEPRADARAANG
jgi:CPA1 family monovalent cation:H+ antiporter